jgi:hypothetical protein
MYSDTSRAIGSSAGGTSVSVQRESQVASASAILSFELRRYPFPELFGVGPSPIRFVCNVQVVMQMLLRMNIRRRKQLETQQQLFTGLAKA